MLRRIQGLGSTARVMRIRKCPTASYSFSPGLENCIWNTGPLLRSPESNSGNHILWRMMRFSSGSRDPLNNGCVLEAFNQTCQPPTYLTRDICHLPVATRRLNFDSFVPPKYW